MTLKMTELNEKNTEMTEEMRTMAKENAEVTKEMRQLAQQNAEMTANMTELMKQNAEATNQMGISTQQNAEATRRMRELAESNNEQTAQSYKQAKSMAALAYDSKRDSEVMKTITVITMLFLPPTFVSVCPKLYSKVTFGPTTSSRQSSAWGSSISTSIRPTADLKSLGKAGFTWPARFHSRWLYLGSHLCGCGGLVRRRRDQMTPVPKQTSPIPLMHCRPAQDIKWNLFDKNYSISSRW